MPITHSWLKCIHSMFCSAITSYNLLWLRCIVKMQRVLKPPFCLWINVKAYPERKHAKADEKTETYFDSWSGKRYNCQKLFVGDKTIGFVHNSVNRTYYV